MEHKRTIIFGGLLAAVVAVVVAGTAAEGRQDDRRSRADRSTRDQDRNGRELFGGPDRRVLRLDGRGSQIGVMVRDPEGATSGVEIDAVEEGSAAAKAGVKRGDLVVEFDGERVRSARQLTRLVQESPAGRAVKMAIVRGGARQTLEVTPESGSTAMSWNFDVGPDLEREIDRGMRRGLRDLPELPGGMFNFRFDDAPSVRGRGRLGVEVQTLSDQLADYFGAKGGGVLVSSVTKDSPAEKAGVHAGDVITSVNGTAVRDAGELVQELDRRDGDAAVKLGVVRDRKTLTLDATIERPRTGRPGRMVRPA